ncbi:MAG: flagellar basal body L-ring protein FlgH [Candidatus Dadabacteria bacterium]
MKHEGSLWQDNGSLSELFIDPTARRIGDIATIQIIRRIPQRSDFHFPGNQSNRCLAGKPGDNLMPGTISLPDVPCQTINLTTKTQRAKKS